MGWIMMIATFVSFLFIKEPFWLIASGLFAIAGAIQQMANNIKK